MEKQLVDTNWNSEKWGYSNSYLIFRKKKHVYKLYKIKTDSLSWTHKKWSVSLIMSLTYIFYQFNLFREIKIFNKINKTSDDKKMKNSVKKFL